jgi:hypothetical protein
MGDSSEQALGEPGICKQSTGQAMGSSSELMSRHDPRALVCFEGAQARAVACVTLQIRSGSGGALIAHLAFSGHLL